MCHRGEALLRLLVKDHHARLTGTEDGFLDVGKERAERVEVTRGDGVELVIVALSASDCLAHPCRAYSADAICEHPLLIVFRLGTAFLRGEQQAIEGGADTRLLIRIRHQVACDLFDGETIEPFVVIEALDDPIAVRPDVARIVAVIADGVGKAYHIKPANGHALAIVRAFEHTLDELLVGIRRGIIDEGGDFFRLRRQAQQIRVKAADQSSAIRFGRRFQTKLSDALFHQSIHRVFPGGNRSLLRHVIRPVLLILRALGDPTFENFFLLSGEFLVRIGRRHQLVFIGAEDPFDQIAFIRLARHEGVLLQSGLTHIEPQFRLAMAWVVAVAVETVVREDRPHITVELDLLRQ